MLTTDVDVHSVARLLYKVELQPDAQGLSAYVVEITSLVNKLYSSFKFDESILDNLRLVAFVSGLYRTLYEHVVQGTPRSFNEAVSIAETKHFQLSTALRRLRQPPAAATNNAQFRFMCCPEALADGENELQVEEVRARYWQQQQKAKSPPLVAAIDKRSTHSSSSQFESVRTGAVATTKLGNEFSMPITDTRLLTKSTIAGGPDIRTAASLHKPSPPLSSREALLPAPKSSEPSSATLLKQRTPLQPKQQDEKYFHVDDAPASLPEQSSYSPPSDTGIQGTSKLMKDALYFFGDTFLREGAGGRGSSSAARALSPSPINVDVPAAPFSIFEEDTTSAPCAAVELDKENAIPSGAAPGGMKEKRQLSGYLTPAVGLPVNKAPSPSSDEDNAEDAKRETATHALASRRKPSTGQPPTEAPATFRQPTMIPKPSVRPVQQVARPPPPMFSGADATFGSEPTTTIISGAFGPNHFDQRVASTPLQSHAPLPSISFLQPVVTVDEFQQQRRVPRSQSESAAASTEVRVESDATREGYAAAMRENVRPVQALSRSEPEVRSVGGNAKGVGEAGQPPVQQHLLWTITETSRESRFSSGTSSSSSGGVGTWPSSRSRALQSHSQFSSYDHATRFHITGGAPSLPTTPGDVFAGSSSSQKSVSRPPFSVEGPQAFEILEESVLVNESHYSSKQQHDAFDLKQPSQPHKRPLSSDADDAPLDPRKGPLQSIEEDLDEQCEKTGFGFKSFLTSKVDPFNIDFQNQLLLRCGKKIQLYPNFHFFADLLPPIRVRNSLNLGGEWFTVERLIAQGGFARAYQCRVEDEGSKAKRVCLKVQKPACVWEFYLCEEARRRISSARLSLNILPAGLMIIRDAFLFADASIFVNEYNSHGNILDLLNRCMTTGVVLDEPLVVYFAIEIMHIVEALHAVHIIHADIKPDNFLFNREPALISSTASNSELSRLAGLFDRGVVSLKLIDFGRAIDMSLLPTETVFSGKVGTKCFQCPEMLDDRPWTYQIDLFGVAATVHMLLFSEYMKIYKEAGRWRHASTPKRKWNQSLWCRFFDELLNVTPEDAAASSSGASLLGGLRGEFEAYLAELLLAVGSRVWNAGVMRLRDVCDEATR